MNIVQVLNIFTTLYCPLISSYIFGLRGSANYTLHISLVKISSNMGFGGVCLKIVKVLLSGPKFKKRKLCAKTSSVDRVVATVFSKKKNASLKYIAYK